MRSRRYRGEDWRSLCEVEISLHTQGRVYGGRPPSPLPSPKRDGVEKIASVAFLMPYNCSKIFSTLCKLVISSTEACTGGGQGG